MSAARVAWGLGVSTALFAGTALFSEFATIDPLRFQYGFPGAFAIVAVAFSSVGAVIVWRRPRNAVGWLFVAGGMLVAFGDFALEFPFLSRVGWPGRALLPWLGNWSLMLGWGFPTLVLLVFPDGRLPSRRWRPVVGVVVASGVIHAAARAVRPGPLGMQRWVSNPFGVEGRAAEAMFMVERWAFAAGPLLAGVGAVALVVRYRRAGRIERQQIKWLAVAAGLAAVASVNNAWRNSSIDSAVIFTLCVAALPVSIGIAILRYRLYDIDRIVSRTLSYALVTGSLGGVYGGLVFALGAVLPGGSDFAIAASTLTVAALFGPVRRRVQSVVDRRFNRARYDGVRTVDAFASRLRDEIDLDALGAELVGVVGRTMQPTHVSLWMTERRGRR